MDELIEFMHEEKLTKIIKIWINSTSKELFDSLNNEDDLSLDEWPEIINHVQERPDGSSDGLPELRDGPNGECTNRNYELTLKWTLEQLYPQGKEISPEEEVKIFNIMREQLFPTTTKLTCKEEKEVYERTQQFLNNLNKIKKSILI